MDLEVIRSELQQRMQSMLSESADLTADTWTFKAVYFQASAGEHLIISKRDWEEAWRAIKSVHGHSALPQQSTGE